MSARLLRASARPGRLMSRRAEVFVLTCTCLLAVSYLSLLLPLLERGLADNLGMEVRSITWDPQETYPWVHRGVLGFVGFGWFLSLWLGLFLGAAAFVVSLITVVRVWVAARAVAVLPLVTTLLALGCTVLGASPWGGAMRMFLIH